jgi:hypothetical protein
MGEKALKFSERLFFLAVWVVIALIVAGFVLHTANKYGVLPGVTQWIGDHTNLSAQAGA